MTKILITGGSGFVGRHLVNELLAGGETDLHITSLSATADMPAEVTVHALDLNDGQAVENLIKTLQPEQIFHLASLASVGFSFSEPKTVLMNNFSLTVNLLESIRVFSPQSKVLLISSADIYLKSQSHNQLDENTPLATVNPYAASKASQDLVAQAYVKSFALKIVIARPFNHIGPGQATGFVTSDFARQIALAELHPDQRVIKVGNLEAKRDFTAVYDMVRAYVLLMEKGEAGEIYNIGSGKSISIQSALDQLVALADTEIKVEVDPEKIRPIDIAEIVCNNHKIVSLGWKPQVALEKVLAEILIDWRARVKIESKP